jgi:trimeric autotransporter adhesin
MRRFSALICSLALAVLLVALTACGGGSKTTPVFGNPAAITVTPASTSLNVGTVENSNTIVTDSKGTTLFTSGGTISTAVTFASSNPNVLTVSTNGLLCAGTWDNPAAPVVCTPGPVGQATLTVSSGGITSTPVTIFVHQPVDRITISGAPEPPACNSKGSTQQLTATVFSQSVDITSTVGPVTFSPNVPEIVSIDANGVATALNPGQTAITANLGNFRSSPVTFAVCRVKSISIHVKGATDTSVSLAAAGTATLTADVTDTNDVPIIISKSAAAVASVGLTWTASSPAATLTPLTPVTADVTATTTNDATLTASRPGTASIVASCTPPLCDAGTDPIYSNIVTAVTTGTTSTTVFVTGTDTTQLIPIPTSTNTPGTAITLSNQPNSLLIGPDGARAVLGSAGGLMVVDANANTFTATITSVTGKVLAIAKDGRTVAVSDTAKKQVFVGDATSGSFQVFPLAGVTAAAFSPDQFRLYLASSTTVTVITTGAAAKSLGFGATDVAPYTSGAFAYFASGSIHVVSACNLTTQPNVPGTSSNATLIKALPGGQQVLAVGPGTLDAVDVTVDPTPTATCTPGLTNPGTAKTITGNPSQIIVTSDGSRAFITNDTSDILAYTAADKSITPITLTGNPAASFTGGVTLDGAQLYVGVQGAANSTPTVHRIDLTTNTDAQQITASTTSFTPNLVAVRP